MNSSTLADRSKGAVIVFFPTVIFAWLGGWWFTGLVALMAVFATYEVLNLMRLAGYQTSRVAGYGALAAGFAIARFPLSPIALPVLSVLILGSIGWQLRRRTPKPIADWSISLTAGLYIGWCCGHLAEVRELDGFNGFWWLFVAVGCTWIADSGAYFVGRRFGRNKLAPTLSPKKTWEGYLGGIATGLLFGALLATVSPLGWFNNLMGALLVAIVGTFGDLAESMFKRQANAKDSGALIPGMGGAFDRLDSLMWAGVAVYYFAVYVAGANPG